MDKNSHSDFDWIVETGFMWCFCCVAELSSLKFLFIRYVMIFFFKWLSQVAAKQTFSTLDELVEKSDKPVLVDFYATW